MSRKKPYQSKPPEQPKQPETSGFAAQGFDGMPNFYEDNKRTGEYSDYSDAILSDKQALYEDWQERDVMPRAKQAAERILQHLSFELDYRAGVFNIPDDIGSLEGLGDGNQLV